MGCKMLKNTQIIHRSDLNSIEILFSQSLSPSCGARKTTFETEEDLFNDRIDPQEIWETEEGTPNKYRTLKRDIEEVLDTQEQKQKR